MRTHGVAAILSRPPRAPLSAAAALRKFLSMSSATSTLPLLAADASELRKQSADWHASLLLDGAPEPLGASARALLAFYRDAARRRLDAAAVEAELKSVLGLSLIHI